MGPGITLQMVYLKKLAKYKEFQNFHGLINKIAMASFLAGAPAEPFRRSRPRALQQVKSRHVGWWIPITRPYPLPAFSSTARLLSLPTLQIQPRRRSSELPSPRGTSSYPSSFSLSSLFLLLSSPFVATGDRQNAGRTEVPVLQPWPRGGAATAVLGELQTAFSRATTMDTKSYIQ